MLGNIIISFKLVLSQLPKWYSSHCQKWQRLRHICRNCQMWQKMPSKLRRSIFASSGESSHDAAKAFPSSGEIYAIICLITPISLMLRYGAFVNVTPSTFYTPHNTASQTYEKSYFHSQVLYSFAQCDADRR